MTSAALKGGVFASHKHLPHALPHLGPIFLLSYLKRKGFLLPHSGHEDLRLGLGPAMFAFLVTVGYYGIKVGQKFKRV